MVKIEIPNVDKILQDHYQGLKNKLTGFEAYKGYSCEEIIKASPDELEKIANHWDSDSKKTHQKYEFMKIEYKKFTRKEKNLYYAYNLAGNIHANVCPYCNINFTFTVKNNKNGISRPEFDHFYSKSKYPILALSFYNLIPSCHTCNATLKGSKEFRHETHINPYSDSFNDHAKFSLHIENSSFYHDVKGFSIEINSLDSRAKNMIKDFELESIYQKHKTTVLELIQKTEIYDESYIDELFQRYDGILFKNREDLLRMIFDGYISDDEIRNRPLSKLIKDISEELELM